MRIMVNTRSNDGTILWTLMVGVDIGENNGKYYKQ